MLRSRDLNRSSEPPLLCCHGADLAQVPGRYRETIELVQETDIMLSVTL